MADLLPCPFCGCTSPAIFGDTERGFYVVCEACSAATSEYDAGSPGGAAHRWNRRATPAVQDERDAELPEPAFRLTWKGERAAYYVSKPNIDSTDCYTAEQMRQQFNAGREFEARRAAMHPSAGGGA